MKKFILALSAFFLLAAEAAAAPSLGITPCTMAVQPADLAYTTASANRQLSTCGETVIVYNNSANDVRFRLGSGSGTTALTTDLLLVKNSSVTLDVGLAGLYIAVIAATTGTGTISFIQGTGR